MSKKFALLVSVDEPTSGVSFGGSAFADAGALRRALVKLWNFDESDVVLLASELDGEERAVRANIEKEFAKATQKGSLDKLVVAFWGLGRTVEPNSKRRLLLADFDPNNINATTVSLGSLLSATLRMRAKDSCFFLDCRPVDDDGAPMNLTSEDIETIRRYGRKIEPGYRFSALCAASAGERSIDYEDGKVGLFTKQLIESALENARRYQGSFDSVAGGVVQETNRIAKTRGQRQFPVYVDSGGEDARFDITPGFKPDEQFDAYSEDIVVLPEPSQLDSNDAPARDEIESFETEPSDVPESDVPTRKKSRALLSVLYWTLGSVLGMGILFALFLGIYYLVR